MHPKFMDILMVFPSGGDLHLSNFNHHLGSAYILAYLKKKGFNANQFISDESYNVGECVKKIITYNPKIVGFSVYDKNYMQCILISERLKTLNSKLIIIFGGPTPSVQSKEILESTQSVDVCVRGEGEEIMVKLLSALSQKNFNLKRTELDNIKGITFKKENKIIINPESNILFSNRFSKNYIDEYPSPYLSKIIPLSAAYVTGIITARGCNQNCIYCNCAVINKRNIFFHSIERVIEELIYINEYKKLPGAISIFDDGFTIIPARAKKICEQIIENNIKLPLACITRCDKVNEELLDLMKQAGFVSVGFSLESAVPKVLRAIGKVNPPESRNLGNFEKETKFVEKVKIMTSYAKKIGMNPVYVSIMLGLPGESIRDAQKTIELVDQLDVDFYTHNYFHIFKGTPIYQNHKTYGYIVKPISQNNKILIQNSFPFDVYKLKMTKRSATELNKKAIDYDNLKIVSLNTNRKFLKPFFDNIIINSDTLKASLVKWMQENLALNGNIIHIYSNKSKYVNLYKRNEATLFNEFSPTMYYEPYYWENSKEVSILKPGRMDLLGDHIGLVITLKNTNLAMEQYEEGKNNMENSICIDHNETDTEAMVQLLIEISKSDNGFNYLLEKNPLPQFQSLCRWSTDHANCQKFETAIIGNDDSIRICWYSEPIGKVGTSFSDILRNLLDFRKEIIKKRNCDNCIKNNTCLKCLYTYPLSSKEYCQYKKINDTNEPVKLINKFNLIKDLLYKPITLLDF